MTLPTGAARGTPPSLLPEQAKVRKLILKCGLSLGDIVMLTAAVRDLHHWYPGRFLTDVRTSCLELWEHNPHVTPLSEYDPQAEQIECSYPLINRCNEAPYHCLHGFIEFLNQRLQLAIQPTAFRGDIHLSAQEKSWYSQVHEVTGRDIPFWLIASGGKYDITIKWWHTARYQQVVEQFRDRVQFVQIGASGHHHPRLEGVIDLRGKTSLRELVRLVYHAQGVLCPVTGLMHLAAAVETRRGRPANRACVVIAGGREPAHWEAYPDHQFIHTNGALVCCARGGCWRDRTVRLNDGDLRDHRDRLCLDVRNELPRCMDLITPAEVIRRIELYFRGGSLEYLTGLQQAAADEGIRATARNLYERLPLNRHSAGLACEQFLHSLSSAPTHYQGPGIVICHPSAKHFTTSLAGIQRLRRLGCQLPMQFWHLGNAALSRRLQALLARLDVEWVDASRLRKKFPVRRLHEPSLGAYALLHSPFREVLLLEGARMPAANPEWLFQLAGYRTSGALLWAARKSPPQKTHAAIWHSCGLRRPQGPAFAAGPMLVDKQRCWRALRLSLWFHEHSDFYDTYLQDMAETFRLAFCKSNQRYSLAPVPL